MNNIYERLCYYDKRNPLYYVMDGEPPPTPRDNCGCDNCFYGRDELALYIMDLEDRVAYLEIQIELLETAEE